MNAQRTPQPGHLAHNPIARGILERIADSWSPAKDKVQPSWLVHEIQFQLGCTYGRALGYANKIRVLKTQGGPA